MPLRLEKTLLVPALAHFIALASIGCLFAIKYAPRVQWQPLPAMAGYAVFFVAYAALGAALARFIAGTRRPGIWMAAGTLLALGLYFLVYQRLDAESLQVDRWSALDRFLASLFQGQFPYQSKTHLGSDISGFPVLFLMAVPFYLLGDVGLLQFAAIAAFVFLVWKRYTDPGRAAFAAAMVLALPPVAYEVLARSDLFANMVAVGWILHIGTHLPARSLAGYFMLAGAWGLLLATRGVSALPLLVALPSLLSGRSRIAAAGFLAAIAAAFLAPFLPFYFWDTDLFRMHNPFKVQTGHIPRHVLILVMLACAILGLLDRGGRRVFAHAGFALFGTVLLCWILKSNSVGWGEALWNHAFDISYFTLAVPFLVLSVGDFLRPSGRQWGSAP